MLRVTPASEEIHANTLTLQTHSARLREKDMEFEESGIGEECGVFGCVAAENGQHNWRSRRF